MLCCSSHGNNNNNTIYERREWKRNEKSQFRETQQSRWSEHNNRIEFHEKKCSDGIVVETLFFPSSRVKDEGKKRNKKINGSVENQETRRKMREWSHQVAKTAGEAFHSNCKIQMFFLSDENF